MTATWKSSRTYESAALPVIESNRIDIERRIIFGVKVLGLESGNSARTIGVDFDGTYRYTIDCIRESAHMYEGVPVFIDHPSFNYTPSGERVASTTDRKLGDKFGKLVNVRATESGLYADLEYIESHPLTSQILEMAERMPEMVALSHHAYTFPVIRNNEVLIEKIESVESVDLIGDKPGTTKSLFESERKDMELGNIPKDEKTPAVENENIPGEETPAVETEAGSPADVVAGAFKQKIMDIVNGTEDEGELKKKIAGLVKAMKLAVEAIGEGEEEVPATMETEVPEEEQADAMETEGETPEEEKPATVESETEEDPTTVAAVESLVRSVLKKTKVTVENKLIEENNALRRESIARSTLESAGVVATADNVEILCGISDKKARQKYVDSLPKGVNQFGGFPMSQAPKILSQATIESQNKQENQNQEDDPALIANGLRGATVV